MTKFKLKNYYEPTPAKIRKIADSILYGLGGVGALGLISYEELKQLFTETQIRWAIGTILVVAFLCKFTSNFFSKDSEQQ